MAEEEEMSEINLRVTGQASQGGRKYMEDAFVVAYQQTEDKKDLEYAFFGVFDGHGGKEAAQYAKNNLLDNIVGLKQFWQDDDNMVLNAIRDGFINTHLAMWKEVDNWPKTASGLPSTAGTTASVAFIRKGKLYTGHVGDSRIIIGLKEDTDEWQAECLTIDHKPETPQEKQRILESGGLVMNKSGVERVVWKRPRPGHEGPVLRSTDFEKIPFLAVARSLGDLWSFDYFQQEFAVSPEPDLGVMSLDLSKDKCLILASDGLWNIMSPQSAVHLVQEVENENRKLIAKFGISEHIHLTLCNPSRVLVDCSLERWNQLRTRADNVSVVTIMLDRCKSRESSVLREQLILGMTHPRSLSVLKNRGGVTSEEGCSVLNDAASSEKGVENKRGYLRLLSRSSVLNKSCSNCFEDDDDDDDDGDIPGSSCASCSVVTANGTSEGNTDCSNPLDVAEECDLDYPDEDDKNNDSPTEANGGDRLTGSPLQSCSNFLPEYFSAGPSKVTRKMDVEGIENSQCPFPRWSKSASGRTSLSKLATWSQVVSHRRMSDPFPHMEQFSPPSSEDESLSDDENCNFGFTRSETSDWEESTPDIDASDFFLPASSTKCPKYPICEQDNLKLCLNAKFLSLKQAIKRKYSDAEISPSSFVQSTLCDNMAEDLDTSLCSSQKRKLDLSTDLQGTSDPLS